MTSVGRSIASFPFKKFSPYSIRLGYLPTIHKRVSPPKLRKQRTTHPSVLSSWRTCDFNPLARQVSADSNARPLGCVSEGPIDSSQLDSKEVESNPCTTIELPRSRKAVRLLERLVGARDCSFRTDFPKHPQNGNPSSLWCCRGPAVSRERSREGNLAESAGRSPRGSASSCATGSTTTTYAAYWRPSEMEEKSSARFSEYLFAKMDGQDVSASQGPRKVTADTRKFMRENLLLIVTLSGVLFGVILGKYGEISKSIEHSVYSSTTSNILTIILILYVDLIDRVRRRDFFSLSSQWIIDMSTKCQSVTYRAWNLRKHDFLIVSTQWGCKISIDFLFIVNTMKVVRTSSELHHVLRIMTGPCQKLLTLSSIRGKRAKVEFIRYEPILLFLPIDSTRR